MKVIFGPTPQTLAAEYEARARKGAARLQAVKDAYWSASSRDDFGRLHDCLVDYFPGKISMLHIKGFLDMVPAPVFGEAIKWSLNDTAVVDSVCVFIEENFDAVKATVFRDSP